MVLVLNNMCMKKSCILIVASAALVLSGCDAWDDVDQFDRGDRSKTLSELVAAEPDLSTFAKVLRITGYADVLGEDQSYTVFAPGNSALASIDLTDTTALRALVQNHLSLKLLYASKEGAFPTGTVKMLSNKHIALSNNTISGIPVDRWNLTSKNGVLHVIDGVIADRMNVWEYLQTLSGNPLVDYIASLTQRVMDMDRSVKVGVNSDGRPVYDTIWTYTNPFLAVVPLDDESKTFTFLLPDEASINALLPKYIKYFKQDDANQMMADIMKEITTDMVLPYTVIELNGRYANLTDVLVDVDPAAITGSYTASNGLVYKLSAVDVKMYQNKIKPLIIEAEDYVDLWPDAWQKRPRTWASGGFDMVLKSRTRHSYDSIYVSTIQGSNGLDSLVYDTVIVNNIYDLNYRNANEWPTSNPTGEPNAYISYKPIMYSTAYKFYWKAYDDNAWISHIDSRGVPMEFYQKLYISFPGKPALYRDPAKNVIVNHYSGTTIPEVFDANYYILAAQMRAGENVETQLLRYKTNKSHTVYPDSYVLYAEATDKTPQPTSAEDIYGKGGLLNCPTYGQSTIFVSNTCVSGFTHINGTTQAYLQAAKGNNAPGMIFLDYIRLEPQVDPND